MDFDKLIGQEFLKDYFQKIIQKNRIPNALLFTGKAGSGSLAMAWAFADALLCNGNENCKQKVGKIIHPDLHFVFPTVSRKDISKPESDLFLPQWREFLATNPYGDYFDWLRFLNAENQQGAIRVKDAENIIKKVPLKPYESNFKVFIIWMAEKMNRETYNKLLKILEEPPNDTKFILITEEPEQILPTVLSRCQVHHLKKLSVETIVKALMKKGLDLEDAKKIAYLSNGDWNVALKLLEGDEENNVYAELFIEWVRTAFLAKKDKKSIVKLIKWSEKMANYGREEQKYFLDFVSEIFRQALMINYNNPELNYLNFEKFNFDLHKLAPFIHSNNIEEIVENIETAIRNIERNAHPKLTFLNLSLLLTKAIHKKEKEVQKTKNE